MKRTCAFLFAVCLGVGAFAKVDYQVVPLPQDICLDACGKTTELSAGQIVSYPSGNDKMKRNALFLQEYLGLKPCATKSGKGKATVRLALGLSDENPEAYRITVGKDGILIQGATESGVFYGIQTLRKSVMNETGATYQLPWGFIYGAPRFHYRGCMLDASRHFYSVKFVKKFIDILALHGLNRFHWHLTDDQGWRYESRSLPELAPKGSYCPELVTLDDDGLEPLPTSEKTGYYYTREQLKDIVAYAADRCITIVPEVELPGHALAALSAYPELGCTGGPYKIVPFFPYHGLEKDVLCAGNPKTLEFIKTTLDDLCEIFPGEYIHIGGDESPRDRWRECPKCQAKMKELHLDREAQLQTYLVQEAEKHLATKGRRLIGWDEILEGGLSPDATVMSWRGNAGGIEAAHQHHNVIMSPTSHCYIDYYQLADRSKQPACEGGFVSVSKMYSFDPIPQEIPEDEKKYIMGAQCNLWTHYADSPARAMYQILPRLAAMSEVQWLMPQQKDFEAFKQRLSGIEKMYDKLGYNYCPTYE